MSHRYTAVGAQRSLEAVAHQCRYPGLSPVQLVGMGALLQPSQTVSENDALIIRIPPLLRQGLSAMIEIEYCTN